MISKYQQAANTRKRGLVGSITDRLVAGQGIGGAIGSGISETFKSKATGIKEKFDPLNIAKMLTGNLGMALLGKITGRKSEDMEYFLNKGRKKGESYRQVSAPDSKVGKVDTAFYTTIREGQRGSLQKGDNVATVAARLTNLLKFFYEKENLQRELLHNFDEERQFEDQIRHDNLIKEIKGVKEKKLTKEEIEKLKSQQKGKTEDTKEMEFPQKPKVEETAAAVSVSKPAAKPEIGIAKTKEIAAPVKPVPTVTPAKSTAPTAKVETPVVKPKLESPVSTTAAKEPITASKKTPQISASKTPSPSANKGLVAAALAAGGISSMGAQANILANVSKESNFISESERLERYTGENLFNMYGGPEVGKNKAGKPINKSGNVVRFNTIGEANALVASGPVAVGDIIYGGRMGNTEPGDGYKYRGRGFIQITGKSMYRDVGKELGIDLVSNPELANDPIIAAKIIPIFFKIKLKESKRDAKDLDRKSVV
jgi:predicted chitinase